jgi:hypothetical protein
VTQPVRILGDVPIIPIDVTGYSRKEMQQLNVPAIHVLVISNRLANVRHLAIGRILNILFVL